MTNQHTKPTDVPPEAIIPKKTPLGLYAALIAAVTAMLLIVIAVLDASFDPVDDGLDNIGRTVDGDG